jgi:hypothetical protein
MATVAAKLSNVATRFQVGTATLAIAATTVITPAVIAQAAPELIPTAPAVSQIFSESPMTIFGSAGIAEADWIYFGPAKPNGPTKTNVFTFSPLALIPGFLQPLFGWFKNINFQACVFGITLQLGPYGVFSGSYSRGC